MSEKFSHICKPTICSNGLLTVNYTAITSCLHIIQLTWMKTMSAGGMSIFRSVRGSLFLAVLFGGEHTEQQNYLQMEDVVAVVTNNYNFFSDWGLWLGFSNLFLLPVLRMSHFRWSYSKMAACTSCLSRLRVFYFSENQPSHDPSKSVKTEPSEHL